MNKRRHITEIVEHIDFRSLRSIIDSLVIERMKDGMSLEEIYEMYRMGEVADFTRCMSSRDIGVAESILDKRNIDEVIKQYGVSAIEMLRIMKKRHIYIKDYDVEDLSVFRDIIEVLDFLTNSDLERISESMNIDKDIVMEVVGYKSHNKTKNMRPESSNTSVNNEVDTETIVETHDVSKDDRCVTKPIRGMSKLPFHIVQNIVRDVNSGIDISKVANKYNVKSSVVYTICKRETSVTNSDKITSLYRQGYSGYDIAGELHIPYNEVYDILKWCNVPLHSKLITDEIGDKVLDKFNRMKDSFTGENDLENTLSDICEEFNLDRFKLRRYIRKNCYAN